MTGAQGHGLTVELGGTLGQHLVEGVHVALCSSSTDRLSASARCVFDNSSTVLTLVSAVLPLFDILTMIVVSTDEMRPSTTAKPSGSVLHTKCILTGREPGGRHRS